MESNTISHGSKPFGPKVAKKVFCAIELIFLNLSAPKSICSYPYANPLHSHQQFPSFPCVFSIDIN